MPTTPQEAIPVQRLVFRCYVRRSGRNPERWVAHCVDLDLWATGKNPADTQSSIEQAIVGYLETVFDTDDKSSIARLLRRKAPLPYRILWQLVALWSRLTRNGRTPLDGQPFEFVPRFHLAHA